MEMRPLDITVISADGLKNVNNFSTMDVYVEAKIKGYKKSKKKTFVDKNGGTNPKWNHSMNFIMDESSLTKPKICIKFVLISDRTLGDKKIGKVSVPIHELFKQFTSDDTSDNIRIVEYPVITENGSPKGSLKFSYKFGDTFTQTPDLHYNTKDVNYHGDPVTAYPAPHAGAGAGMSYPPPPMGYQQHPHMGYQQQQPGYGYPPQAAYGGYPPNGYPPAGYPQAGPPGYGYHPAAPPPGYGYAPAPKQKKSKFGGMGMGLGAGLLGGLLIGDMVSDVGEMAAYNDGYDDAMGGFDF